MSLIKHIKIIIISTILLFNTLIEGYEPSSRYGHGSIVFDNNLYFFGGYVKETDGKEINTNDFFYIDLSKSFDRLNPQYIDLKTISNPPISFSQGSLTPNSQGTGFHVIGGVLNDIKDNKPFYDNFIYEYDETTKSWSVPKISNSPKYSQLKEFDSVFDDGKSYIFGGINDDNPKMILEMQVFDSESLSWSLASNKIPNLQALSDYTATLLPGGLIVYIGGTSNPLSDIYIYDTRNDIWNFTKIDAQGIDPRSGHTAVLASDNRIIVYGGVRDDNSEALPQLVVLDTNDYKWITPKIEEIESRVLHKANLVDDYMIISFGKFTKSDNLSNEIRILNTRTYEWVDSISFETIKATKTYFLTNNKTSTDVYFPTFIMSNDLNSADDKESNSFFSKVPKYIQAAIFCLCALIVFTIIFLVYYNIRQKKKTKTRHLSVLPYTNCNEEAKEDIIRQYSAI
ncbi:hypothetical protein RclHR1_06400004 [Rhizophagus clarus]|uniref:Attractin/MKLN-like beta-propeller domain-containing protein n=1 Tax=Rhizophagus clarus TaxID=94130 RepID=A0A2Z6RSP9_9GLOM|nr:hypothetical protein RclHR1_06400004 [Rhizophagus clarus]GES97618.1 hypothetical protein GLOIN_2v435750 [Rhizophagus clarus]